MPTTITGRWSARLSTAVVVLLLFSVALAALSRRQLGDESPVRPLVIVLGLLAVASGIAAFVTGLVSLIRDKERSFLVYISTIIGLLIIFLLVGEFLFPH